MFRIIRSIQLDFGSSNWWILIFAIVITMLLQVLATFVAVQSIAGPFLSSYISSGILIWVLCACGTLAILGLSDTLRGAGGFIAAAFGIYGAVVVWGWPIIVAVLLFLWLPVAVLALIIRAVIQY